MSEVFRPSPFRAARWLRGPHAQTIVGRWLRSRLRVPTRRERLELPDGDFVDLDWVEPAYLAERANRAAADDGETPLVLVLHGLEGCSGSGYAQQALHALAERGLRGVAMNFRSCSGPMNRSARFYHAGDTADVERVLRHLAALYPSAPRGALGFSLGGNMLLKLLGERGADAAPLLRAAAAVSVPYDLAAGGRALERGMGRVYTRYFLRRLLRKARRKAELLRPYCDLEAVGRARTLRQFDDLATAPLHGFRDADEYYRENSSAHFLARIRLPTLLLQAVDDPFLPEASLPRDAVRRNPALIEHFSERGGHVGFVAGPPWAPRFWAEQELARFFAARLLPARGDGARDAAARAVRGARA